VIATDPDDGSPFLGLFRPTGKFDETGLSGFEFLLSSQQDGFRANDQLVVAGEESLPETTLAADLGGSAELSGVPFAFSIRHNLVGGRHFAFSLTNLETQATSVLCWGMGCPSGSLAAERLAGIPPIDGFNGLQIQARAQEVSGASVALTLTDLQGLEVAGADLFDEVVTPASPGTVFPFDLGRRGQWIFADDLELVEREWDLQGLVTLTRPDEALTDVTKVRLAVDFVRDPDRPFRTVPEPVRPLLAAFGLALLGGLSALSRRTLFAAGTVGGAAVCALACASPTDPYLEGRWVDLTWPFDEQTVYWPTEEGFVHQRGAEGVVTTPGTEATGGYWYAAHRFRAAEHGGTHLDAPLHFARGGTGAAAVPLAKLAGPGIVVDVRPAAARDPDYAVGVDAFATFEAVHGKIPEGAMVLVRTGFGRFWPDRERYLGTALRGPAAVEALRFPGLHPRAARWLAARKVTAVGIDTASIDPGRSRDFPSHRILAAAEVPVFENVAHLEALPPRGFTVIALPMKIRGGTGAPLRIAALLPEEE